MDNYSPLLREVVNYIRNKFYNIGPWVQCYKTFYVRNLQMFVMS